jgi:hypothetical protein
MVLLIRSVALVGKCLRIAFEVCYIYMLCMRNEQLGLLLTLRDTLSSLVSCNEVLSKPAPVADLSERMPRVATESVHV